VLGGGAGDRVLSGRVTLPVVVWFLLASVWGSTWLFIKIGLADLPPLTFAGIRFVIASVPLVIWLVLRRAKLPTAAAEWRLMVVTGLLTFAVNYGLVFWGESHISSGLAAILYTTFPMFGMVLAHLLLPAERLTWRKAAGVLVAAGGVAVIFYHQAGVQGAWGLAGSAALVLAAGVTAYAGVLIKRDGGHLDPVTLTAVQMVVSFPVLLLVGLAIEGDPRAAAWTGRAVFALVYLALVGSSLTFVTLYWLMQRMPVTRTMLIPFFSTLVAVALGWVVLGERPGWRVLVGAAGILGGLAVASPPVPLSLRERGDGGGAPSTWRGVRSEERGR
jgi:drug/metabolite transporter (DMT)-like permease